MTNKDYRKYFVYIHIFWFHNSNMCFWRLEDLRNINSFWDWLNEIMLRDSEFLFCRILLYFPLNGITLLTFSGKINFIADYSKQIIIFQSVMNSWDYFLRIFKIFFNFCSSWNTKEELFLPNNKDPERYIIFNILVFAQFIFLSLS